MGIAIITPRTKLETCADPAWRSNSGSARAGGCVALGAQTCSLRPNAWATVHAMLYATKARGPAGGGLAYSVTVLVHKGATPSLCSGYMSSTGPNSAQRHSRT